MVTYEEFRKHTANSEWHFIPQKAPVDLNPGVKISIVGYNVTVAWMSELVTM
jgi:hypothetical protein